LSSDQYLLYISFKSDRQLQHANCNAAMKCRLS